MSSKKAEEEKQRDERIEQTGQLTLEKHGEDEKAIHMITIIGEIEGHDNLGSSSKRPNMSISFPSWQPLRTAAR